MSATRERNDRDVSAITGEKDGEQVFVLATSTSAWIGVAADDAVDLTENL